MENTSKFSGFTLMELVVVMALMAVILSVSFPRIRTSMEADQHRRAVERFIVMLENSGKQAYEKKEEITLVLAADGRSMQGTGGEGDIFDFPDSFGVQTMRRAGKDFPETREIGFYPEGYSDPVFFWIDGVRGRRTLIMHPLIMRVEVVDGFIFPEGWDHE
ncbi:prepilin-type N-terminal cleavage/methylation domain-containing protein [Desulfobotulus mexicanus]|uniref:prepilin-type N-terminal cleavage/methylation domain-containing protein n=1 Tax=Desulfobotulus mexicanus TaxID=2586642 RepID=UPI0015D16C6D|nr:prepilin-type N-terminal cleavage/methylation domain-containing protein [Desulfobotulus mexicanus]